MDQIGVREAKINLSKLLKRIKQGGEVILTERGTPVGKIVPMPRESLSLADRLKKMEEQGLLEPQGKGARRKVPPPLPVPEGIAQQYLQEERGV
jgi:prevent-host-death family protein